MGLTANSNNASYSAEQTSHTYTYNYVKDPDVYGDTSYYGSYTCYCNEMPEKIYPGDTVTMHIKAEILAEDFEDPTQKSVHCGMDCHGFFEGYDKNGKGMLTNISFISSNGYDDLYNYVYAGVTQDKTEHLSSSEDTLTIVLSEIAATKLKRLQISFCSSAATSYWYYKWVTYEEMGETPPAK